MKMSAREVCLSVVASCVLVACGPTKPNESEIADPLAPTPVEVIATDFAFQLPDEIPSGWTTFRFINEGNVVHFFLLNAIPDGVSFADYVAGVSPVFEQAMEGLKSGAVDKAGAVGILMNGLPEWYGSVRQMGGAGLVSSGRESETTLYLSPGSYALECYVKSDEGIFHTALGMVRHLTVSVLEAEAVPPEADVELRLSNYRIAVEGGFVRGENTVAVHFDEHPELGLGNDVHLVRMEEGTSIEEVIVWMDWMEVCGMQSPAPAVFLGGTQEMPIGNTAFFTADLIPGRYALLAESSAAKGMVLEFEVD